MQLRGLPPFYSRKYDLKQHPNFKHTAEADKKNAFDLDRLINRNRRPGLNEVCEVHEVSVPDEALVYEDEDILNYDDLDDPDAFVSTGLRDKLSQTFTAALSGAAFFVAGVHPRRKGVQYGFFRFCC